MGTEFLKDSESNCEEYKQCIVVLNNKYRHRDYSGHEI